MAERGQSTVGDDTTEQTEAATSAQRPLWRRVLGGFALAGALVLVAAAAGGLALFYPLFADDYQLDQAVRSVALDWRDFGEARARQRLQLEFSTRQIGSSVAVDNCTFVEDEGREVRCAWGVEIALPGGRSMPLAFESVGRITASGDLL